MAAMTERSALAWLGPQWQPQRVPAATSARASAPAVRAARAPQPSGAATVSGHRDSALLAATAVALGRRLRHGRRLAARKSFAAVQGQAEAAPAEAAPLDFLFTEDEEPLVSEEAEDNEDPAFVLGTEGEIAIVRAGCDLKPLTKTGTVVEFGSGAKGVLMAWKESIGVVHLENDKVTIGDSVSGTEQLMRSSFSTALTGRILNCKGEPLDGRPTPPVPADARLTFAEYKSMQERTKQYRSLFTGVQGIDFSVPIGRGQTMLFQGTDAAKDREHLWADLMAVRAGPDAGQGPELCACVCNTLADAEAMRDRLEERGCWDRCVIVVPTSSDPGAGVMAMNAAVAFAEHVADKDGEALVIMDLEPMHRVWNILAGAAGEERRAKGIIVDPKDELWTELEGTVIRESIAERRKFWFALVSRALNSETGGTVSLLPWVWEQQGGLDHRRQKAFELKLEEIERIPRISEDIKERLRQKIKDEAKASGLRIDDSEEASPTEPAADVAGVPNWEVEELKSISDGHVILRKVDADSQFGWSVDPYLSLPRLGTDALHPALISADAPKLRLKMMQGQDRATMLHDTLGALNTLDKKERLEMKFVELLLDQPAGVAFSAEEQVARLAIIANPKCRPLRAEGGCTAETLRQLTGKLLETEAGRQVVADIGSKGEVSEETIALLAAEVESLESM